MVSQVGTSTALRLIKCGLGEETFALDLSKVQGLERADRLRLGSSGDDCLGRLPGPGAGVAVYNLAARLGRPGRKSLTEQHVVVVNGAPAPWGLLVDRVSQVITVSAEQLDPLPAPARNPYCQAVVRFDLEMILLLDADALGPLPVVGHRTNRAAVPASRPIPVLDNSGGFGRGIPEIVLFATTEAVRGQRPITFGVSKSQVLEIREFLPLLSVPRAPAYLQGLANWRSLPVPVFDLGQQLGLAAAPRDRRTRLMIVHAFSAVDVLGFLVRPSIRVMPLPLPHAPIRQTLALDTTLAKGIFELRGETVVIPDIRRLFCATGEASIDDSKAVCL
jgi:purine-binding chemotaxis protein CheW